MLVKNFCSFDIQKGFVKFVTACEAKEKLNGLFLMNVYLKFTDSFFLTVRKKNFLCLD